jgi:hypothetical protein
MAGIIRPIIAKPAKHIYNMLSNPEYFQYSWLYSKLNNTPRYCECQAKINNWHLSIPDSLSFINSYKEIFVEKIYIYEA